jgi:hypothetical protein
MGTLIEDICYYISRKNPDVYKNNKAVVEILAKLLINTVCKAHYVDGAEILQANMICILAGKPKSGKGSLLSRIRELAPPFDVKIIGETTDRAFPQLIKEGQEEGWDTFLQIWEEIGELEKDAWSSRLYTKIDKVWNKAYYSSALIQETKDHKRRVYVREGSYFYSALMDCTDDQLRSFLSKLTGGFERRVLPLKLADIQLPAYRKPEPIDPELIELSNTIKERLSNLNTNFLIVVMNMTPFNDVYKNDSEFLQFSDLQQKAIQDYVVKLTVADVVNTCEIEILRRSGFQLDKLEKLGKLGNTNSIEVLSNTEVLPNLSNFSNYTYLTNDTKDTNQTLVLYPKLSFYLRKAEENYITLKKLFREITGFEDPLLQRYIDRTKQLLSENSGWVLKSQWITKVAHSGKARKWKDYYNTLKEINVFNEIKSPYGFRSNAIMLTDPSKKFCYNCPAFNYEQCLGANKEKLEKGEIDPFEEKDCFGEWDE